MSESKTKRLEIQMEKCPNCGSDLEFFESGNRISVSCSNGTGENFPDPAGCPLGMCWHTMKQWEKVKSKHSVE